MSTLKSIVKIEFPENPKLKTIYIKDEFLQIVDYQYPQTLLLTKSRDDSNKTIDFYHIHSLSLKSINPYSSDSNFMQEFTFEGYFKDSNCYKKCKITYKISSNY